MSLILDEEQQLLQTSARGFFSARAPISQLRALRDENVTDCFDRATWSQMVELGWAGIPWPERFGGLAFGFKGLGIITEQSGRCLTASPLISSIWLCGAAILLAGSETQKLHYLPSIANGRHLLAMAFEERLRHAPGEIDLLARRTSHGFVLSGGKRFVLDGISADTIIVAARICNSACDTGGISLFLVPRDTPGVTAVSTRILDSRNVASIDFIDVQVPDSALLGAVGQGPELLDAALDIARIGLAAEMLGSAQECFERTVQHLKDRRQFGVALGSFQSLKHRAAQMFCQLELSRSVVLEALTALDEDRGRPEIARLASLAKARLGATFHRVTREAVQMHGGIAMTDEFDIGLFIKRAAVADQTFGDVDYHVRRYAELEGY
jgi:acyl-CoA dehydrogenase